MRNADVLFKSDAMRNGTVGNARPTWSSLTSVQSFIQFTRFDAERKTWTLLGSNHRKFMTKQEFASIVRAEAEKECRQET
jgi:hypothetical protein